MDKERLLLYKTEIEQLTSLLKNSELFKRLKKLLKYYGIRANEIFLIARVEDKLQGEEYGVILVNRKRIFTYFIINSLENIKIKEIKNYKEELTICPQLKDVFEIISLM